MLPPTEPRTFFCVGMNYASHIEHARSRGNTSARLPDKPEVGYRASNALIGHGSEIVLPSDLTGLIEAEPELVAVIGRQVRRASPDEARDAIFGWTIGNDVSAREWQYADRTFWRAKNSDTFKPMGPWIVTDVDPARFVTTLRVNDEEVTSFTTGEMIFDAVDYIVAITRYITMYPGDVLWLGADGSGALADGDDIEIEISGIGSLCNTVVAEEAQAS
ncbi:MAG TPA: fumarylacetoacetate hydrolase family protein [Solirubrobacteraceae bacterium]|nr:fumarylacetoacetate hydrolase family protein [Solirubrobacteraceae bacterium]